MGVSSDFFDFGEVEENVETQPNTTLSDEEWAYTMLLHNRRTDGFTCANGAAGSSPLQLDCDLYRWAKQNVPISQAAFRQAHRARQHRASVFFRHGGGAACPALQLELTHRRMCGWLARPRFASFAVAMSGGTVTVLLSPHPASDSTSCAPTAGFVPP